MTDQTRWDVHCAECHTVAAGVASTAFDAAECVRAWRVAHGLRCSDAAVGSTLLTFKAASRG